LQTIGSIRSVCFGLRSGLTTNWQYTVRGVWDVERSYNQLAVYGPCALGLEEVLQPIGHIRYVRFVLRSGLTTN